MCGDQATSIVIDNGFFSIGMEKLTGGKLAFINFTENLLNDDLAGVFPKEQVAIEILETVEATEAIIARCRAYREKGYMLVLDDFIYHPNLQPLVELANIIKVDFLGASSEKRREIIDIVKDPKMKFLAERVETLADYEEAVELGYSYFQGYYFAKPEIVKGSGVPSYKLNYLKILQLINQPNLNFDMLENIFKQDVSLSYKLMRYINSPYFGFPREIKSIRHALNMIGLREAKKWLSLMALSSIGKDKSEELVRMALSRATMCELAAPLFGFEEQADDLFLLGLFSLLDAFLDMPMDEALAKLPLANAIINALLGNSSPYLLVHKVVTAYERGDWELVFNYLSDQDSIGAELPNLFFQTIDRCTQLYPA